MINQESVYKLILQEKWSNILDILYGHRSEIKNDILLKQSAEIFEKEFFSKVDSYPVTLRSILDNLDTLYVLHHGKFYVLSDNNYKTLVLQLVKRKPLDEAINYAKEFPDEEVCKGVIKKFPVAGHPEIRIEKSNVELNWIAIFNRLFELINNQGDNATYFSGPKFINVVREFDKYFPDYHQYIDIRNREGKSTSRKIFFYDILMGMPEEQRIKVLNRFLELLKPFQEEKVGAIEVLLGKDVKDTKSQASTSEEKISSNPVVLISYSWDDEEHKQWVLMLADRLRHDGVDVILDRYYLKPGKSLTHFVESSIARAERIIIIFTPNYKLKADKRTGGVGYEYSIINAELYSNQVGADKVIPMLRRGAQLESIPTFMQQYIHIDIRNDENFENSYTDLLREIYNEPAIQKPALGLRPQFDLKNTDSIEKPILGHKPKIK
jgi:hypothetical protein